MVAASTNSKVVSSCELEPFSVNTTKVFLFLAHDVDDDDGC